MNRLITLQVFLCLLCTGDNALYAQNAANTRPLMKDFIGINTRSSDGPDYAAKFGFVREYHEWSDDTGFDQDGIANCPQNLLSFNPSNSEARLIDLDDYYGRLSNRVSPCMKWLAPEMRGLQWYNATIQEQKPLCGNIEALDQESPEAYFDYARWVSIFTARYGKADICAIPGSPFCELINNTVVDKDVLGASISGLGSVRYMELGNEPDKWWYDTALRNKPNALWQMMPQQYAALLHAAYDGAGKSPAFGLSPSGSAYLGIKNIDPDIKVAMAGISDFRGRWLKEMLDKAYSLRATNPNAVKKIPFDILNIHHYLSNNANIGGAYIDNNALWNTYDYYGLNNTGLSPEQGQLKQRCARFFERLFSEISNPEIRNELSEMAFWLSEFGYDTNNNSAVKAKTAQGNQSYFTTQAQWLVRAYLELSAAEYEYNGKKIALEKAVAFDLRDGAAYGEGNQYSPGGYLYTHCGLLTKELKPKRSWYFVQTLKNTLGETRFSGDLNATGSFTFDNGGTPPRIYYYRSDSGQRYLAIWSPTSAGVNDRKLTLSASDILAAIDEPDFSSLETFTIISMQDNGEKGVRKGFDVTAGKLVFDNTSIPVSETPFFVWLGQKTDDPQINAPISVAPTVTASCNGALLEWATNADPAGHWKVLYAQRSYFPDFADCQDYRFTDLLGSGYVQTYTTDLTAAHKRLLMEGLKPNTAYLAFMVYINPQGVASKEPYVVCFSTNNSTPCVANPCLMVEADDDCGGTQSDFCKLVVENAGSALNNFCPGGAGCLSGNPQAVIGCNTYSAATGCGAGFLYPENQLWSVCNQPGVALTFDKAFLLDAIRFYHHSGMDPVEIYYTTCDAPDEKIYLTTFRPAGCNQWVSITNNLPTEPVKRLYFNKVFAYGKSRVPRVKIGKLHFCGQETGDCGQKPVSPKTSAVMPNPLLVFPNPNSGTFSIRWSESGFDRLSVFSADSLLLIQSSIPAEERIWDADLSAFPPGIYFIRLSGSGKKPISGRVLVEK